MEFLFFLILAWVAIAAVVAWLAGQRGHNSGVWFVLALFFSPMLVGLLLFCLPRGPGSGASSSGDEWVSRSRRPDWNPPGRVQMGVQDKDPLGIRRR